MLLQCNFGSRDDESTLTSESFWAYNLPTFTTFTIPALVSHGDGMSAGVVSYMVCAFWDEIEKSLSFGKDSDC